MIGIYAYPYGISLNPREWALEGEGGDVKLFNTNSEALAWLNQHNDEQLTEDEYADLGVHIGEYDE
jgi:hypothetical protein